MWHVCGVGRLRDSVRNALHVVINDPALLKHCVDALDSRRGPPSSTTLARHRITLFVGWQMIIQDKYEDALRAADGCTVWWTMDSSPQGGWDFVMQGGRVVRNDRLVAALNLAHSLCSGDLGEDEEERAMEELHDIFQRSTSNSCLCRRRQVKSAPQDARCVSQCEVEHDIVEVFMQAVKQCSNRDRGPWRGVRDRHLQR